MYGSPQFERPGVEPAQPQEVDLRAHLGPQAIRSIEDDALEQQARLVRAGPLPKERGRFGKWLHRGG